VREEVPGAKEKVDDCDTLSRSHLVSKGNLVILHAYMIGYLLIICYYEVCVDYYYFILLEFGVGYNFVL
jgi:hypothetical protein